MSKKKTEKTSATAETASASSSIDSPSELTETKRFGNLKSTWKKKLLYPIAGIALLVFVSMGVMAKNGWLPATDVLSGKKIGWFGVALPNNASNSWNPFSAPAPQPVVTGTPQLSKEYIYAGSRMLAVEDAGADVLGIEGDVFPRPNSPDNPNPGRSGDGEVNTADVNQVRRFQIQIDTPETVATNEYQKADVHTFNEKGDGGLYIDTADVVQIRKYQNGTNPKTAAGGPTQPGGQQRASSYDSTGKKKNNSMRTESLEPVKIKPVMVSRTGNILTVGIELDTDSAATGVNALSFTLNYDPAVLSPANDCQPGSAGRSAGAINILCNFGQPGSGFVGAIVDLDPDQTFSSGAQQIGLIEFTVAPGAGATTGFNFGDAPSQRFVSDILGNELAATYTANTISLTPQ